MTKYEKRRERIRDIRTALVFALCIIDIGVWIWAVDRAAGLGGAS